MAGAFGSYLAKLSVAWILVPGLVPGALGSNDFVPAWLRRLCMAAHTEVFMENVADSSQSRIKMVNDTVECDASAYSEARSSAACGSE